MKTLVAKIQERLTRHEPCLTRTASKNAYLDKNFQWYLPALAGPATFLPFCIGASPVREARAVMDRLSTDQYLEFVKNYYDAGLNAFGDAWVYGDINTFLLGVAKILQPESYLEIGVRRGRSACMVASQSPKVNFVGFDMWIENYAGMENPGESLVRSELMNIGHSGTIEFHEGDSRVTIPKYFAEHPDAFFDIITVDGDHSVEGARLDLENVMPRLKSGGILIFDDTCNQSHPGLDELWNSLVGKNPDFATHTFNDVGFGVGIAVKKI